MKKHNFSAGPAILPEEVKIKSAESAYNHNNSGLSLMEVSHRGEDFIEILDTAESNVRKLFDITDDYAVLFLTGGASTQFYMSALNLVGDNEVASYLDTGAWSAKAIDEAKNYCRLEVVASSKSKNYNHIPRDYKVSPESKYLHLTSNNTIFGTQIKSWPDVSCPLVCDMSSDIFSRAIPLQKFGFIYAGAQKNVGPAGVTLVIVKKNMLGKVERFIPTMLNYQTHIKGGSSYNTPPVFPIFVTMLTLQWILDNGGVAGMEKRNAQKASTLYNEIDSNPLFFGSSELADRSPMNATFLLKDEALSKAFLDDCDSAGIVGLEGHRSVGGFRASMYNALELESVEVLVSVMNSFAQRHG